MELRNQFFIKKRKKRGTISQINVTPFVDVMLVLLIVFMITAPLLTVGVSVDLPKTKASQLNQKGDPLILSIKSNGKIFIQDREIDSNRLIPRLKALANNNMKIRVFIRGDKKVNYGNVVDVLSRVQSAGFSKATLVAKLKQN
ncbi:MAG: protein TolR [SAR116 cluster bacterium]|jgi:biopolymer transport protein TolR|nr:protein TolR [SAR116 cluster bacterium]